MGSLTPRTFLSQFRKRGKISLDGQLPGITYNHYRRGQRPATAPINRSLRAGAPPTYMSLHADIYEPDPGEACFSEALYSPYQPEAAPLTSGRLHEPVPEFSEPEPEPPEYDNLLMTEVLFNQAMRDLERPPEILDPIPFDNDIMAQGIMSEQDLLRESTDRIADLGYASLSSIGDTSLYTCESPGMPDDTAFLPDDQAVLGPGGPHDTPIPGTDPRDSSVYHTGPDSLEQIVEELAPLGPGPEPMMAEQFYEDEMLLNPWMMPGMGPMPPGLGPKGPMP